METKFRPIPITILDFLGVLVPGFLWLVLLADTYFALRPSPSGVGLVQAWRQITAMASGNGNWSGTLFLVLGALVIGYTLKPLAMSITEIFTRPLLYLRRDTRQVGWQAMKFPFNGFFSKQAYYPRVCQLLSNAVGGIDIHQLHGTVPFAAAKRYLRATAPTLWEESERMEAEVRMAGALFLAASYSVVLNVSLFVRGYDDSAILAILSFVAALFLAVGFNVLRLREVGYTYLNLLLVEGARKQVALQSQRNKEDKDEDE